ncbi:pectin lyase fold/virulence factor [Zopfochytrium polystomum]|nr:pectin lyase fold/virulence factor [Zopfochytrium polystomum]
MRFLRVLQRGGGCAHRLGPPARRPPEAVAVAVAAVLLTAAMLVTPISTMIPVASAQLAGPVGPLTPLSRKSTICNVVDYEAAATGESFDIGPAILSAFENCVKPNGGATLYVPPGDYNMSTWVTLNNGANWAFQMDGTITRTGTAGGHMIIVNGGSDFEMFSSTQAGAFQGAGVDFHKQGLHVYGPRILRLVRVVDFSLHDLIFVDSPSFHVFLEFCVCLNFGSYSSVSNVSNGMIYNLMIRGHDEGGLDGIDISGDNNHVKNIEVTNRDECVCVKSGGMSMGSYNQSTAVSNIHMRNIVSYYSTHFLMIKTYPNGNGYVRDPALPLPYPRQSTFENFSGFTSAYGLLVNQYWQNTPFDQDVSGVALSNLTFSNWTGVSSDANQRPPTFFACSAPTPASRLTASGRASSPLGTARRLTPAVTNTLRNPPVEWTQPGVPAGALDAGFNLSTPIAIPAMPFPPIDPAALDTDTDDAPSPASSSSSSPPSSADTMASTAGAGAGAGQAQAQGARAGPAQASSAACGRRPRRGMLACNAFAAVGFAMITFMRDRPRAQQKLSNVGPSGVEMHPRARRTARPIASAAASAAVAVAVAAIAVLPALVSAQLSGPVGPTTPLSQKTTVCNILDYGASTNGSDVAPAILAAFNNCVKKSSGGATLYVPPGDYSMVTWVTLNNGHNWAFQMDGTITRTGIAGGHMIIVNGGSDFEMFSSTQQGAFQGAGVDYHKQGLHVYGPRILRVVKVSGFSVHDLIFVDSPAFHVIFDNVSNGFVYNLIIRGHDEGGLDGIDISCNNCHVQNIEVTNRDECVCVKSPSSYLLIEDIFCNQSGGMSMGSYNQSTAVANVHMRNIVSYYSTQFLMIKTYPNGNGYVKNCTFENFSGFTSAYALLVDQYWQNTPFTQDTSGVVLSNLTFSNWTGASTDANQRPPTFFKCSMAAPCTAITVADVKFWDATHAMTADRCQSAYGAGACLAAMDAAAAGAPPPAYAAVTTTRTTIPDGWAMPAVPARALAAGFPLASPIVVPALPFAPLDVGGGAGTTETATTATTAVGTVGASGASSATAAAGPSSSVRASGGALAARRLGAGGVAAVVVGVVAGFAVWW